MQRTGSHSFQWMPKMKDWFDASFAYTVEINVYDFSVGWIDKHNQQ